MKCEDLTPGFAHWAATGNDLSSSGMTSVDFDGILAAGLAYQARTIRCFTGRVIPIDCNA